MTGVANGQSHAGAITARGAEVASGASTGLAGAVTRDGVDRWSAVIVAAGLRMLAAAMLLAIATTVALTWPVDRSSTLTLALLALIAIDLAALIGAALVVIDLRRALQATPLHAAGARADRSVVALAGRGLLVVAAVALVPVIVLVTSGAEVLTIPVTLPLTISLGIPLGVLLGAEMAGGSPRGLCGRRSAVLVAPVGMSTGMLTVLTPERLWPATSLAVVTGAVAIGLRWLAVTAAAAAGAHWELLRGVEGRRRAEWIHDTVLSEVSHAILLLRSRPRVDQDAVTHLEALDHRLRIAQLDATISSGPTRVASILQPYLRRAEALGLHVTRIPAAAQLDIRVEPATGRVLHHVLSVLVANAANAGAGSLGFELEIRADEVEVALHDDAGGFELSTIPPGRALDELRTDLGGDRIRCEPSAVGSVVRVRVPRAMLFATPAQTGSVDQRVG